MRKTGARVGAPLRIVHGPSNIAGLPIGFARAQRALGHRSIAVLYPTVWGGAQGSVDLQRLLTGNRVTRKLRRARVLAWLLAEYDIFHFHFHTTFLQDHRDLALLRAAGKRIVFHLHGCDIRDPRRVRREHGISACAECAIQCLVSVKLGLPAALRRYADAVIVSTPDLLEFVPEAIYLPNPLDVEPWEQLRRRGGTERPAGGPFVVVHAPTDRAIKGTRHVEAAVAQLRAEGLPIELRLLEGMSREAMREACRDADIAVDQVLVGWIGLFALEMMALGKPVVAYIRPDLAHVQPDMPVANADPQGLACTLRRLLNAPDERNDLARRGPAFVGRHHAPGAVNERIIRLYRELEG